MRQVLRAGHDVGLLSNHRMSLEIAVGLAYLSGRRLSLPFEQKINGAPNSSIPEHKQGRPARELDLWEVPVETVHPDEWRELEHLPRDVHVWEDIGAGVCVADDAIDLGDQQLLDFANGRKIFWRPPVGPERIVEIQGRLLSFYSYFFFARSADLRRLHGVLRAVRVRRPYRELANRIVSELGSFSTVHFRRTDLTLGIEAYGAVTPESIADNLATAFPTDEPLLVCSEADPSDEIFDPLRRRFATLVFANDLILHDHGDAFFSLPRHEDNALGLVTQEVATASSAFVGTLGSTFTAIIQRQILQRDPTHRFRFTADYSPAGPIFENNEFVDRRAGSYSWNRIGYAMSPDVLAWFREWPEAA